MNMDDLFKLRATMAATICAGNMANPGTKYGVDPTSLDGLRGVTYMDRAAADAIGIADAILKRMAKEGPA